jgi:hypothetical protein
MPWERLGHEPDHEPNHEPDHEQTVVWDAAPGLAACCRSLLKEIEALEEQHDLLEEVLLQVPGVERGALSKEVAAFRRELGARYRALRRCRGTATSVNASE